MRGGAGLKASLPVPALQRLLWVFLRVKQRLSLWEALTFHHDLQGGLAVLDAMHHLAAVDPRVIGAQALDFQGGVTGDGRVVGQRDFVLVGTVDSHTPFSGHQQHYLLLLGHTAPLDSWGQGGSRGGGGHRVHGVDEIAGDGEGGPQEDPQRGRLGDADTQRVVMVCVRGVGWKRDLLVPREDHPASPSILPAMHSPERAKSNECVCLYNEDAPVPCGNPQEGFNALSRAAFLKTPGLCTSRRKLWSQKRIPEEGRGDVRVKTTSLFLKLGYCRGHQSME